MNIFFRELKANLRSLLIWGGIIVLFILLGVSKFSAYFGNPDILKVLDAMPPAMLAAFQLNAFNLTTVEGFMGVMYTWFALLVGVASAMWGSDIISKEERDKTVEFSLTLPVTRARLVTAKTLAAIVNCIVLLGITWGACLVSTAKYEPGQEFYEFLTLCMVTLFIMQMVFLAVGIFLGCALRRYRLAGSITVSVLLVTYFLSLISVLREDLEFLGYFSPFTYFNPAMLLNELKVDPAFVGLSVAIMVVLMVGAYFTYSRRDLYV
jgi:ABC-2 type transport system permease protein